MKTRRLAFVLLIVWLMSCNFATRMVFPPTLTPTFTVTASLTPSLTASPTATALVPAYVPPQCAGQSFPTVSPAEALARPTPAYPLNKEISQVVQLHIFIDMVTVIEKVYLYPDYNGHDWDEIKGRYRAKIVAGLDTESFYKEISAMIDELGDDHSHFLSPVDVQLTDQELQGQQEFIGIGIYANFDFEKHKIIVMEVYPDSPAEHGGLQVHDSIVQVDGLPITAENGDRLRGPLCSPVVLDVQSPADTAIHKMLLIRSSFEGNAPLETRLVKTSDGSRVGYIDLSSFYDESYPQQMEEALNHFGTLDGLILDLRENGGGINTVTFPILSLFVHGKLGDFVSRTSSTPLEVPAHEVQNSQTVPLIILVGRDTASFGEIFSGIMQDSGRAQIVGETSLGNVEILRGYQFDDGSLLWIASEKFVSAFSNADWEITGIIPDMQAYADWDTFTFDTDPAIAASLQLLGHP